MKRAKWWEHTSFVIIWIHRRSEEPPEGHINMQLFMMREIKPLLLIHYR